MGNIKDKVAIIGMGCTKFGDNWSQGLDDMIIEAVDEALNDAGIEVKDIEAAWLGTFFSGVTGARLARPLKLQYIPVTRVENACGSGMDALRNASFAVAAGMYDLVLVVGCEKLKDFGHNVLVDASEHPIFDCGRTSPAEFALLATRYFHSYGLSRDEGKILLAKIAVKNHHNGTFSPKAHFQREISIQDVLNAPMVSWPLGLYDCCPRTDGAAVAVLTRADMARKFRDDFVLIKAFGVAAGYGTGRLETNYDFLHIQENVVAARQAYQQAGIKEPFRELDLAEVHDCFTITELVNYEDLGFCPRGQAKDYVNDGAFTLQGELPVNTDGGLKSFGHPQGASGLRMVYELYLQMQGKASQRQLKHPRLGLAHNVGGFPSEGTVTSIAIVGRDY